jgi:cytidine deaminase
MLRVQNSRWGGTAVLDIEGTTDFGCNVKNVSYPEGTRAETNAIGAIVSSGLRLIKAIAIVGGPEGKIGQCRPCGGCRQRILEFSS